MEPLIILHGSARTPLNADTKSVLEAAAQTGISLLRKDRPAIDAAVESLMQVEDSGVFNAGTGASLNLLGEREMEAAAMDGSTLKSGAVALVRSIKNPVALARKVMEETDQIMLAGAGAEALATAYGLQSLEGRNEKRYQEWLDLRKKLDEGSALPGVNMPDAGTLHRFLDKLQPSGTIGAVALDSKGSYATAISTGGTPLKLPGRIGDIPIIGASSYCDNRAGGVCLTGSGNLMVRHMVARSVCDLMRKGYPAQTSIEATIQMLTSISGSFVLGIVAIDVTGQVGAARNLDGMPHVYIRASMKMPVSNFGPIIRKEMH